MESLLQDMKSLGVQKRTFALAQNGTWAPVSAKLMTEQLSALKNVKILEPVLTIKSALHSEDQSMVDAFVDAIANA